MKINQWQLLGVIVLISGIMALVTGRAGLTYYGHTEGISSQIVGILMVIYGIYLVYPKK